MVVSLVIPIYNEEGLIDELIKRSVSSLIKISDEYEVIVVDDGSTDETLNKLLQIREENKRIKILSLSRNFGHQSAYTAGLEFAKGDFIAMMDGDLQDPPELLELMYRKLSQESYDIISGKRTARKGGKAKNFITSIFHYIFKKMANIEELENAGNFSMMNRQALNSLLELNERIRYLPGLRSFIGYKQGYIEYVREERIQGNPKMNFTKLFGLASDAIFSFSRLPIRLCFIIGLIGTIVFLIAGIYALIAKVFGSAVLGWSSTVLSIYFLGSIQLIFLGIVGEYVFRIYKESQKRPHYFIRKIYDQEEE